jgi:dihydrofolate synthase / folylpolyglutamate synthase
MQRKGRSMKLDSMPSAIAALGRYVPHSTSMDKTYSLQQIRRLLKALGDPQEGYRTVHIAGTSGKTSTAYFVRSLIQETGQRVGLTISPHVVSITDRVQIDGSPLDDESFLEDLGEFLEIIDLAGVPLTYFEVLVSFAYWNFARRGVEYAVVETGLGGLLDGTNTISRTDKLCLITDLGLDHTEVLGETLEEIAWQKAGIIQPGNEVLLLKQDKAAMQVITERARSQGASIQVVEVSHSGPEGNVKNDMPLFQRRNWSIAYAAWELLRDRDGLPPLSPQSLKRAATLQPPGRFERYNIGGKTLVLDGAHNPQKLAALRESLKAIGVSSAPVLANLIRAPHQKLISALTEMRPLASHLIVANFTVSQDFIKKSVTADEMVSLATEVGFTSVEVQQDLRAAISTLLSRPEPVHVITGSLYLISQARTLVEDSFGTKEG